MSPKKIRQEKKKTELFTKNSRVKSTKYSQRFQAAKCSNTLLALILHLYF